MIVGVESFVEGRIIGVHREPFGAAYHPHVWEVRVVFEGQPLVDAAERIEALDRTCAALQPDLSAVLGDHATNEGIAQWVLLCLQPEGAKAVRVRRAHERSGAVARLA